MPNKDTRRVIRRMRDRAKADRIAARISDHPTISLIPGLEHGMGTLCYVSYLVTFPDGSQHLFDQSRQWVGVHDEDVIGV